MPALHPRQGVLEQSQFKGGGKGALHKKGAHIQRQGLLEILTDENPDWWESSQLPSSREEAAAHRSWQLEEEQGLRRVSSMDRPL